MREDLMSKVPTPSKTDGEAEVGGDAASKNA